LSSLFLIAVREIIGRRDLTYGRSRRHCFSPGNTILHLKSISALRQYTKKKAIKPNPHADPWDPVSWSPCIPHYAVFLFSSLQIKSFQPLLLELPVLPFSDQAQ
jgi:hypothetical protein